MKRLFIGIGCVSQAVLSLAAIVFYLGGSAPPPEIIPFALFLAAAALSLILLVGDNLEVRPVLFTASLNALAIGIYCITPAFLGADAQEEFAIAVESGSIILTVGLPAGNSLLSLGSMVNTPIEITRVSRPDQKQDGTPEKSD